MLSKNDIWKLMARTIFGEATSEEKAQLQEYLKDDPALQQQFDLLSQTLTARHEENIQKAFGGNQAISRILNKANSQATEIPVIKPVFKKYIPLAAASVLLILLAGWVLFMKDGGKSAPNLKPAFATENGSRRQMILPDSSRVWLNGGSKLFFDNNFAGATREVSLEGEAFFEVVRNTSKPFIVHANKINIKVLGTSFNVKAYKEDTNVETTLYTGLVNITKTNDNTFQPILLYPNQKIIIPREAPVAAEIDEKNAITPGSAMQKSIIIQQIDSNKVVTQRIETAWMYNRLEFRGDGFTELARKLERWYNVKIIFEDEKVKGLSFNGSFEKENIEQAMLALSTANSFNYKIQKNEVFISSKR